MHLQISEVKSKFDNCHKLANVEFIILNMIPCICIYIYIYIAMQYNLESNSVTYREGEKFISLQDHHHRLNERCSLGNAQMGEFFMMLDYEG